MRFTVNIDCSPEEARSFFGLPDVAPMQEAFMQQVQTQMQAGLEAWGAANPFRPWMELNLQAFNQFRQLCLSAANTSIDATRKRA